MAVKIRLKRMGASKNLLQDSGCRFEGPKGWKVYRGNWIL